jgi:hypothetical protein
MAKTFTIDNVSVNRVQFIRDVNGSVLIYAEYDLKSGTQVVQSVHKDVTTTLSASAQTAAATTLDSIAQGITSVALT